MSKSFAIVFPGQGSQHLNMGHDFMSHSPVNTTFNEAKQVLGYDLTELIQSDEEKLNDTRYTQVAILTLSVAIYRLWSQESQKPSVLAGHSLGEFSALIASGVLSFEEGLKLVAARAGYMHEAVQDIETGMGAIIGLSAKQVDDICKPYDQVSSANYNSALQTVIAGPKQGVLDALEAAKSAGAKIAKLIPVSVPSHTPLMASAASKLKALIDEVTFNAPTIPVYQNVTASAEIDPGKIKQNLIDQLTLPVRWTQTIEQMRDRGITTFVECGPGNVLTNLIKRMDKSFKTMHTKTHEQYLASIEQIQIEEENLL